MRINSSDEIAGVSIIKVRNWLRRYAGQGEFFLRPAAEHYLRLTSSQANRLEQELLGRKYVEYRGTDEEGDRLYETTVLGNAFALASAAKPVTRKTAERAYQAFMQRVADINADERSLWNIAEVVLFGSFLDSTATDFSDVDLAVSLKERRPYEQWSEEAKSEDRWSYRYGPLGSRPYDGPPRHLGQGDIVRMLKDRSPVIGLIMLDEAQRRWLAGQPHRHVYPTSD